MTSPRKIAMTNESIETIDIHLSSCVTIRIGIDAGNLATAASLSTVFLLIIQLICDRCCNQQETLQYNFDSSKSDIHLKYTIAIEVQLQ